MLVKKCFPEWKKETNKIRFAKIFYFQGIEGFFKWVKDIGVFGIKVAIYKSSMMKITK